jgi:hypothetical protein
MGFRTIADLAIRDGSGCKGSDVDGSELFFPIKKFNQRL